MSLSESTLDILKGIDLHIRDGESVAIVGASGSGKSTLLGMLAGLDVPTAGQVILRNIDITKLNEEERSQIRLQNVAFVFQNFQLLGSLTALENVLLPLEIKNHPDSLAKARSYLAYVGLKQREAHYPHQLSGGEQQRVAIARAFACEAPILFADEPTGNLDSETGAAIAELLFTLNSESNTTLILVTHDHRLARRCDRQLRMTAGKIEEEVSCPSS